MYDPALIFILLKTMEIFELLIIAFFHFINIESLKINETLKISIIKIIICLTSK